MKHVVIGGGIAGVCCVEELCRLQPSHEVTLISSSTVLKVIVAQRRNTQTAAAAKLSWPYLPAQGVDTVIKITKTIEEVLGLYCSCTVQLLSANSNSTAALEDLKTVHNVDLPAPRRRQPARGCVQMVPSVTNSHCSVLPAVTEKDLAALRFPNLHVLQAIVTSMDARQKVARRWLSHSAAWSWNAALHRGRFLNWILYSFRALRTRFRKFWTTCCGPRLLVSQLSLAFICPPLGGIANPVSIGDKSQDQAA